MKTADLSGDGMLVADEFKEYFANCHPDSRTGFMGYVKGLLMTKSLDKTVDFIFEKADADKNKFLSCEEVIAFAKEHGAGNTSAQDVFWFMRSADIGDSTLCFICAVIVPHRVGRVSLCILFCFANSLLSHITLQLASLLFINYN